MTEEIENMLDAAQDEIFALRFQEANKKLLELLELLAPWASELSPGKLPEFNKIMGEVLAARQKSDSLLLADLMEEKLRPFLKALRPRGNKP
jgi:hypothetical protein